MSSILSDYNSNSITASNVARSNLYADLDLTFMIHPTLKDIMPITDIEAVKASVKNLVLTSFYERPFQPAIGSRLRNLLFESVDPFVALELKDEIVRVISESEPRVNQVAVDILDDLDNNAYQITITFNTLFDRIAQVQFNLNRLR